MCSLFEYPEQVNFLKFSSILYLFEYSLLNENTAESLISPASVEASWKAPRIKTYLRRFDRPSTLYNSLPCLLVFICLFSPQKIRRPLIMKTERCDVG